jgi:hypothetical protein
LVDKDEIGDGGFAVMFTAMLPGELASSAATIYDGIQTANFMYNVVIINADNALNPSANMRIIYTTIQKNTLEPYFNYENSKQTLPAQDGLVGIFPIFRLPQLRIPIYIIPSFNYGCGQSLF